MGPALACSETTQRFLVVWQSVANNDIHARLVDSTGARALVGSEIEITQDPDWQSRRDRLHSQGDRWHERAHRGAGDYGFWPLLRARRGRARAGAARADPGDPAVETQMRMPARTSLVVARSRASIAFSISVLSASGSLIKKRT